MERPELRDQANLTLTKNMEVKPTSSAIDARERINMELYKTYDVMTGIRIAATLGGFLSMMILLVLYKNYCKPSKTLSEEQLNAAVTAAVEEEDRALKAALEATSFYTSLSKQRQSITHESNAITSPRFSSVGGGYSHLAPPTRFSHLQQRGKSLPGSALRFTSEEGHYRTSKDPDFSAGEEDEEEFDTGCQLPDYFTSNYLNVPPDRRLSSITCSSADTSYLERRGSAFEMGRPAPPGFVRNDVDKRKVDEEGPWDFYYPIDIQVIQPTPEITPAGSVETLCEKPNPTCALQVPGFHDRLHRLSSDTSEIGLAPLASISSLASLSSPTVTPEQADGNQAANVSGNEDSVGSDSVFMDEGVDTEDEVEEFSTDSEFDYGDFDDDYSFCESNKRPMSRCQKRSLQFASFDSYDASIGQDTLSEERETGKERPVPPRQPESIRAKRKLMKTHSEPRSQKTPKQLPPWIEKGRSGYVPKRQLSVPGSKRRQESAKGKGDSPPSSSESNKTASAQSTSTLVQGLHKDVPSTEMQEEKRKRFQKQKTVNDDWVPEPEDGSKADSPQEKIGSAIPTGNCNTLRLPQINVDKGSCERLNVVTDEENVPEHENKLIVSSTTNDEIC
ncbi:UNVERIFIED_CONTAM: hypothetical protein PYX00_005873 [Menopon gallinae]|uniref:Uncharacterized protein n=1 Tax=Menopon gallinae TaxID=328185 RepID=A0AAW2HTS0_9NEOP